MVGRPSAYALAFLLLAVPAWSATYYVSPTGNSANVGTQSSPWSFRYACNGAGGRVQPGDTVWALDGIYPGHFACTVSGSLGKPVILRSVNYWAARLDGNASTTSTSDLPAGAVGDTQSITLANLADVSVGQTIILNTDHILGITSISGATVTGVRNCAAGGTCAAVPKGAIISSVKGAVLTLLPQEHDITIWGFDISDSGTDARTWPSADDGALMNQVSRRRDVIFNYATRSTLIDLTIHDGINGLGAWDQAVDSEYSGLVIYHNGMLAPDRWHGHGIYTQNTTGRKVFRQVTTFDNGGYGIQQYGSENAHQDHYLWDQLITWNQTTLFGGHTPMTDLTVQNSHYFRSAFQLGYDDPDNVGVNIFHNVFAGNMVRLSLSKAVRFLGNTVVNGSHDPQSNVLVNVRLDGTGNLTTDYTFTTNTYVDPKNDVGQQFGVWNGQSDNCGYWWFNEQQPGYGYCLGAQSWQALGWDIDSTMRASPPTGVNVDAMLDPYDNTHHTVVVENWDLAPSVTVDVSSWGWTIGQQYRIRPMANFFGDIKTLTYAGGSIAVSLLGRVPALPNGMSTPIGDSTFPAFGAFLIETLIAPVQTPTPAPCKRKHWWSPPCA